MNLTADKFVGEIAVEMPQSIPYFEEKGIDYCCGGQRSLQEACSKAGVSIEETIKGLSDLTAKEGKDPSNPWPTMGTLIQYLQDKHHTFTRDQLALVAKLGAKVLAVHGNRHSELAEINRILGETKEELLQHLVKEERVAFPFLRSLEGGTDQLFSYEVFQNAPQRVLMEDHLATGEQLAQLRQLTKSYTPPEGACVTFRAFYRGLADLESDIHRHIHLENNVLFPMAEKLAASR